MTTGKRHIPINDHVSKPEAATGTPAGTGPGDAGPATEVPAGAAAGGASRGATEGATAPRGAEEAADVTQPGDALADETGTLARERDELSDALLRLRAEFENFRKRASRELVDARVRAQADLLGDLLPVLDNLERALDAAEHHEEGKVLDGVRLTRNQFVDLLGRAGVEEIESVGAMFDPQVHDAMLVQPSEHEEGTVAAVLERGYRQGERVLRPARVIVSSGPGGGDT